MPIFNNFREAAAKRKEDEEKLRQESEAATRARIEAARKRQAEKEAAILSEKQGIIERNSAFFEQVVSIFEIGRFPEFPWIAQKESYRHNAARTVFIGDTDLSIYRSTPPKSNLSNLESDEIWPEEFYIISGHPHPNYYTKLSLTYPDHFSYAPISDYVNRITGIRFSSEEVLKLVAEEIHSQLNKNYPSFRLGELKTAKSEYHSGVYFYFQYEAPYKELTSW